MSGLRTAWRRLQADGSVDSGYVRLRLPGIRACAAYAARSVEGDLEAVILEVNTASLPGHSRPMEARGLALRPEVIAPGRHGRTRLVLALLDRRYRNVFQTLAEDVVSRLRGVEVEAEAEAVEVFLSRLERWQGFLRRHGPGGLSQEERRGLFGELFLLRHHLIPAAGAEAAVRSWKGCKGGTQDFQTRAGGLEVKASGAHTPHAFHVASVRQLEVPAGGRLFVFVVFLDEAEAGESSLRELVEAIRGTTEGEVLEMLDEGLLGAGYLDGQGHLYDSPRYTVRAQHFFRVGDGFPRLREADLPEGVEAVRYEVALAACRAFRAEPDEALGTIFTDGEVT